MAITKFFGADGIRGKVGAGNLTPDLALKLGWAVGKVLSHKGAQKVIIGKDTRISGYLIESALKAGFSAAGFDVLLMGTMPTPAIAYLTQAFRADIGVAISASSNPFYDNGIKFFSKDGNKLTYATELAIEAELENSFHCLESHLLGKITRINTAPGRYIEYCKGHFPPEMTLSGLKIVVDCAHGATHYIAPNVFHELGANVITIGDRPNGLNINDRVGATSMAQICNTVLNEHADVGIALDGGGDRLLMVNAEGEVIDGDQILYILACDAKARGVLDGGVVGTLMSNLGLEQAMNARDIPFIRSQIGHRSVMEQLRAQQWSLGGENCGHILSLSHGTSGDGIVAGISVLAAMQYHQQSLSQLTESLRMYPQVQVNIKCADTCDPINSARVQMAKQDVEVDLGNSGRVLLRKSEAESLICIMVEGDDEMRVIKHANYIAEAVRAAV